jgi:acetyl-CoA carboxylase carboxyl transferase subunit alpha
MSKRHFLDFEQPIAELESKIEELRYVQNESAVDISDEIERLSKKSQQLTKDIYSSLSPWQVTQIARHPQRPYTLDYVNEIFTDFQELHGDRHFADDLSIVGGLARFNGQACMVLGHQKGRDTKERTARNFGMSAARGLPQGAAPDEAGREVRPAGVHLRRHARRLPRHRCRGARPVRGHRPQHLRDGAAGGAHHHHHHRRRRLGRRAGHQRGRPGADAAVLVYSVISPEGCASILWKTAERASDAAEALGITAHRLKAWA